MADAPAPELHVDAELVARLVETQYPELAGPVEFAANGWDNAMYRLDARHAAYAVRLPRRRIAAPLIEHEQRWLPVLAERLPVAVPAPVRSGRPAPELGFDAPWSIVPWFDGVNGATRTPADRAALAPALAAFIDALHLPAPADAPHNPFRGVPLAARDDSVRQRFAGGRLDAVLGDRAERLREVWEDALAAPVWSGTPTWLHGDLHPGNLVLEAFGALAAVIDFGDLTAGDPATDLATAWLSFDAAGRAAFVRDVERRRPVDAATWRRARGWAVVWGSSVVDTLDGAGPGPIARLGRHALEQVLVD
ncbi:aminoglycoside phosphotransferase family protein [Agromyces lapidis]|uniref:Aminoglycoside phosphotransferase family protein n=1 Tax=Agromyces lapidis TaxID=279574 RepID=A0ABV5SKH7_9MICO|nr:aminoglycoside phosphotransferase family protein [Agromyces lapidis]